MNFQTSNAFTMIELIFVIVILGILSAVAIPKLYATRTDAKAVQEVYNLSVCIHDIGSTYNASGNETVDSAACDRMKCFTVDRGNVTDGSFVTANGGENDGDDFCNVAQSRAGSKGLVQTFDYGENNVVY